MKEYRIWAFARSAAPNLPALEEQLADVMREADRRGYIIVNSCMEQKYGTEFWRPALFAMLTAVQQGRVNAVIVQSLDRLSHDIATLPSLCPRRRDVLDVSFTLHRLLS